MKRGPIPNLRETNHIPARSRFSGKPMMRQVAIASLAKHGWKRASAKCRIEEARRVLPSGPAQQRPFDN